MRELLAGDRFAEAVREDERLARALGIDGVPFFVVDGRYGISGAQPSELIASALAQAWGASRPPSLARLSGRVPQGRVRVSVTATEL